MSSHKRHARNVCALPPPTVPPRRLQACRRRRKAAKMVAVIVVLFAAFWLPIHVFQLWTKFDADFPKTGEMYYFKIVAHTLSYANSCVNPIVYCFLGDGFRRALARSWLSSRHILRHFAVRRGGGGGGGANRVRPFADFVTAAAAAAAAAAAVVSTVASERSLGTGGTVGPVGSRSLFSVSARMSFRSTTLPPPPTPVAPPRRNRRRKILVKSCRGRSEEVSTSTTGASGVGLRFLGGSKMIVRQERDAAPPEAEMTLISI